MMWLRLGIALAVATMVAGAVYNIYDAGAESVETRNMRETIKDTRERNVDDVETQKLSDFDICVRDTGGMPICDTLK